MSRGAIPGCRGGKEADRLGSGDTPQATPTMYCWQDFANGRVRIAKDYAQIDCCSDVATSANDVQPILVGE